MNNNIVVSDEEIKKYRQALEKILAGRGYYFNPDESFTDDLLRGILFNLKRYGYEACPCRLAVKDINKDLDIICPCYYRDDDVSEYGTCYCGLYVSRENFKNKKEISYIPERRTKPKPLTRRIKMQEMDIKYPVWRCEVCGYLCARDTAPDVCPICGAKKERFTIFLPNRNY